MTDTPDVNGNNGTLPRAQIRRPRFSVVWVIPIIAAVLAGYLGYRTVAARGPLLTLTFDTGSGLTAGQTQVQYKSVTLGVVEGVDLGDNNKHVIVRVRMNNVGARFLTDHARFWVVRPSFGGGNLSGLQTLVSGDYISVDPGLPGGHYRTSFIGLEEPPGVRSDDPGRTFVLKAANIGALGTGSPVFYRDIPVGEVLGYDIGNGLGPVTVNIFVRAPYDRLVQPQSHFWNSSGISAGIQGGAFHVEFQSLQALLSGGVTFNLPPDAATGTPSPVNASFPLYASRDAANAVGYLRKIPVVTYFKSSVNGLAVGAPVDVLGIQIGQITDVKLVLDLNTAIPRVRVAMELQPERVFQTKLLPENMTMEQGMQKLVNHGLRAEVATANYVTGQQIISLVTVQGAAPVQISTEGEAFVLPGQDSSFAAIATSLSAISSNLAKVQFDKLSDNLNKLLVTTNKTVADAHIQQALAALSQTLLSLNRSYGNDSDFQHGLEQLMIQANSTLQSLDQLTSYLDRHPEALLRGRSSQ
jgi:paraquat-inducible protein B